MFQNVYQRAAGGPPVPGGTWPTRAKADEMAALNESPTFRRVRVAELPACHDCGGDGRVEYYVGTYGTSSCSGPAERLCDTCGGTGELDYA